MNPRKSHEKHSGILQELHWKHLCFSRHQDAALPEGSTLHLLRRPTPQTAALPGAALPDLRLLAPEANGD